MRTVLRTVAVMLAVVLIGGFASQAIAGGGYPPGQNSGWYGGSSYGYQDSFRAMSPPVQYQYQHQYQDSGKPYSKPYPVQPYKPLPWQGQNSYPWVY